MKDALGQPLEINDYVMFIEPNTRNLVLGTVSKVTPKGASVTKVGSTMVIPRQSAFIVKVNAQIKENPEILI